MAYYSEYPKGSGRYWAVPLEADAIGWAYRKDWFEDPSEMKAFKEKYGYDLAPPKTWMQLRDIAEFFYRPHANPSRYGIAIYTEQHGDGLIMGFIAHWRSPMTSTLRWTGTAFTSLRLPVTFIASTSRNRKWSERIANTDAITPGASGLRTGRPSSSMIRCQ
jgi:ABC-type glycerol-3-phosphate transport system substrate-binding protein